MTTIQPRTSVVTIYQGDYLDRLRHIEQRYQAALKSEKDAPRVLTDSSQAASLADEHEALRAEAEATAIHITVKALGRRAWRELVAQHPERPDHKGDAAIGVNEETFKDALVAASVIDPELTEDDFDSISDIDNDRLYFSAFALNRAPATDPKALDSPTSQTSDET